MQWNSAEDDPLWTLGTLNRVRDGGIRWHSTNLMLRRCFELKGAISRFQRQMRSAARLDDLEDFEEELGGSDEDSDDKFVAQRATLPYDPLTDTITEDEWEEFRSCLTF